MELNPVALAIPFFFLLMGVEYAVLRWQGKNWMPFNDAMTALGCGVIDQTMGVFLGLLPLAIWTTVSDFRLFDLPGGAVWTWVIAILGVDFSYYWWHRASHRVNFIWATHVVHHQSDEYNLAVALRQAVFAGLTAWPFYLPWLIIGVPLPVFLGAKSINLLYQFWIHTRLIGRLGPVEWVMNTPSHHRVHHGINRKYIDRNYAGIFIVWDRMFGTFQAEEEPVLFGTVTPFRSWNPLWANLDYWHHLWTVARSAEDPRDRVLVWFAPPEWSPRGAPVHEFPSDEAQAARPRYDADVPKRIGGYVALQFVPIAILTTGLLLFEKVAPWTLLVPIVAWIVVSHVALGAHFERKPWAVALEAGRMAAGILLLIWMVLHR